MKENRIYHLYLVWNYLMVITVLLLQYWIWKGSIIFQSMLLKLSIAFDCTYFYLIFCNLFLSHTVAYLLWSQRYLTWMHKDKYLQYIAPQISRSRHGHAQQFQQRHTKSDAYCNSFFVRTVREWNKLPSSIVNPENTDPLKIKFKTALNHSKFQN